MIPIKLLLQLDFIIIMEHFLIIFKIIKLIMININIKIHQNK